MSSRELEKGRLGVMNNKTSVFSAAFLATGLLLGFAGTSQAASGAGGIWIPQPEPRAAIHMVSEDLNAADRALPAQTQAAPAATDAQGDTQTQSAASVVSVVASSSDEDSGSNMRSLIGEIFIGFGTLLTLVSSALRMLMG
jgi:hypothetical protein